MAKALKKVASKLSSIKPAIRFIPTHVETDQERKDFEVV